MPIRTTKDAKLRTYHRVWVSLVNELRSKGVKLSSELTMVSKIVKKLKDINGLAKLYNLKTLYEIVPPNYSDFAVGVDSSRSRLYRAGLHVYAAVTAAAVFISKNGSIDDVIVDARNITRLTGLEPSVVDQTVTLEMFKLEVEMLKKVLASRSKLQRPSVVFIDGPLVDPPRPLSVEGYDTYIIDRARVLSALVSAGFITLGVVKRISGSVLVKLLSNSKISQELDLMQLVKIGIDDWSLLVSYISYIRKLYCNSDKNYTLVIGPLHLSKHISEAKKYEKYIGHKIMLFFISPRLCGKPREALPVGIEFIARENIDPNSISRYIASIYTTWLIPGTRIPIPVQVAHIRCSIRSKEANKLYRALLERVIFEEIKAHRELDTTILKLTVEA